MCETTNQSMGNVVFNGFWQLNVGFLSHRRHEFLIRANRWFWGWTKPTWMQSWCISPWWTANNFCMVDGWPTPLKNMSSPVGIIPNISIKSKHVPKHQPGCWWIPDFLIVRLPVQNHEMLAGTTGTFQSVARGAEPSSLFRMLNSVDWQVSSAIPWVIYIYIYIYISALKSGKWTGNPLTNYASPGSMLNMIIGYHRIQPRQSRRPHQSHLPCLIKGWNNHQNPLGLGGYTYPALAYSHCSMHVGVKSTLWRNTRWKIADLLVKLQFLLVAAFFAGEIRILARSILFTGQTIMIFLVTSPFFGYCDPLGRASALKFT